MQASNIIAQLYNDQAITTLVNSLPPHPDPQDVKQQAFTTLLEKPADLIMGLQAKGELLPYACQVIKNTANWTNGTLRRQLGKEVLTDNFGNIEQPAEETTDRAVVSLPLDRLHWFNADLIRLYMEHRTYRKVAMVTGIPVMTVFDAVKKGKQQLKKMI